MTARLYWSPQEEHHVTALYRDGLVLVFLGYHPLRLRNLRSLRLGHHLIALGHTFLLKIDASETKARRPIEQEVAPRLRDALKRYIGRFCPVLLRARGRWHAPATDELWISRDGSPCSAETFRNILEKHTRGPDGRPLTPHLFRSMAATTVAVEAPGAVDVIPVILTHRSPRTAELYYNLATSLEASRAYSAQLDALQTELERGHRTGGKAVRETAP